MSMSTPWKNLTSMEYPGRMIAIGKDGLSGRIAVVYAITGRSPSSQARRLENKNDGIWTRPTDENVLKTGNIDLLVYPALLWSTEGIAVSNGKQTTDIHAGLETGKDPVGILSTSLSHWEYEPDAPIHTPRINGCILPGFKAALGSIRRVESGAALRTFVEIPLVAGKGWLISTYDGINRDPLESFTGDPREAAFSAGSAAKTVEDVYEAMKPRDTGKDFRVAAVLLIYRGHRQERARSRRHQSS